MIRVGRRIYNGSKWTDPTFPGFSKVIVMTSSTEYGSLSPYDVTDDKGRNIENNWQFAKVYEKVPYSRQVYSRYDSTVIWEYPEEVHAIKNGNSWTITEGYIRWRLKGMYNKYAVRYPVGYNHRHKCLFSLLENPDGTIDPMPLDYVQSRKKIYLPLYDKYVRLKPQFKELKERLAKGENLLIIEVDGPHEESMSYYKEKYNVADDFIQNNTVIANKENLTIFLNDEKHAYGHSFCLAGALLDINSDLL